MENGTKLNGAAQGELVLVRDGGLWLVGERVGDRIEPAFELICQAQRDPATGGVRVVYAAQPMLLIAGLNTWLPSPTAQVWRVAKLGAGVDDTLRQAVSQGQQMAQGMRAAQAGLAIAREMPKVKL